MAIKVIQRYINLETGMLFITESSQPLKLDKVVGKKVKYEQYEMDVIKIGDVWYDIIGYYHGLAHIKEAEG